MAWLDEHAERAQTDDNQNLVWGRATSPSPSSTRSSADDERALLERAQAWTHAKAERGYHAIAAPPPTAASVTHASTPRHSPGWSAGTSDRNHTRRTASRRA